MNVFDAINAGLDNSASRSQMLVIGSDGKVYVRVECTRCGGRGHFFRAGECYACRGSKRVLTCLGEPSIDTVREALNT